MGRDFDSGPGRLPTRPSVPDPDASVPWSVDSLLHANHTPTWEEAVEMATALAASDARATLHEVGMSDVGRPIHALVLTGQPAKRPRNVRA